VSCGAKMWGMERTRADRSTNVVKFSMCCMKGKIELPPLKEPPSYLKQLLSRNSESSLHFVENVRAYNMMFAFTSMGGKIDKSVNQGRGPYCFKLGGQNYHRIGSLLPDDGNSAKFQQLYIVDTQNEVKNRKLALR
jgi:hypothetical protein